MINGRTSRADFLGNSSIQLAKMSIQNGLMHGYCIDFGNSQSGTGLGPADMRDESSWTGPRSFLT